jgi:type IV secretion system protein VirB9
MKRIQPMVCDGATRTGKSFVFWILTASLFGATTHAQERTPWMASKSPGTIPTVTTLPTVDPDPEAAPGFRSVVASPKSLFPIATKLRYTTMIVLPEGETIVDTICGDAYFWTITTSDNIANVKPNDRNKETNVNFISTSGTVYSFLLRGGKDGKPVAVPDLKVDVLPDPAKAIPKRKFYTAEQYDAVQGELVVARQQADAAAERAAEQIAAFQRQFPTTLKFDYAPWVNAKPFFVRAIWHDDKFTYLRVDGKEKPSLYELVDGEPSVVNYQVENNIYVVPKVLDRAYLALGKERFPFSRQ